MHGMRRHAHASAVDQREGRRTLSTKPIKLHSGRVSANFGIEPKQELDIILGLTLKAEEFALVQVKKTSRARRVRAL
jgi:hypothetical protein